MSTIPVKAAVFVAPNAPLEIRELQISDQPGPHEVLVKLAASGVCHSDLHALDGDWDTPAPLVLGHEGAGVVLAVGSEVTELSVDDHVILSWTPSCQKCEFCVSGTPVLCQLANETAYQHVFFDGKPRLSDGAEAVKSFLAVGSFGEYAMVPASAAIRIRKDAPLAQAALVGCAVTTGIGAVTNTAGVEPGSTVLVVGCGGVGLNVVQGARLAGAKQIIVADVSDEKLELGRTFGATHVINSREVDLLETVRELTGGRGVDYAFEAIGLPFTIEACYEAVRRGGTAVVVGQVADGVKISIDPFVMSDQEKKLIGSNYGSSRQSIDFPKIIDLYMEGLVDLDSMVTDRITLDGVNDAFAEMRKGRGIRSVIEY
ncbi:S-(hydroxymethyl)glutathione dehydrogenase/alcohol dehydrogenase [Leucobacter luti]|uniref:Zn-dependent alcohol dehydrogenase n=1 Tax=Leucobacter luti TaxID=340320 RepID=UPI00104C48B5|nr:Zn-dependent alcohol dehydrogenase [Leucobacter luti]MCW2288212.1 S-(hydroxymethyl)glutathione dehydrogenase/alcohol dehydrogenase [Leucobacter luti]TCK45629.1 S-(hydroxymethyl)glutathione dehydrogenase/alcohol dehydrogenase [Leucobacter luti]